MQRTFSPKIQEKPWRTCQYAMVLDMTYQEWLKWKEKAKSVANTENSGIIDVDRKGKSTSASIIMQYDSTVQSYTKIDAQKVYLAAKHGERNKGICTDAIGKRKIRLEKSIASHTAQVEEHARKIKSPGKYDTGWNEKDERQKQGLIKKWGKDLWRNAEQAEIEIEVWKERFMDEQ